MSIDIYPLCFPSSHTISPLGFDMHMSIERTYTHTNTNTRLVSAAQHKTTETKGKSAAAGNYVFVLSVYDAIHLTEPRHRCCRWRTRASIHFPPAPDTSSVARTRYAHR